MPNQKGSLIDRLRSWNLFLKYKFKLWKKKIEENKRKKKLEKEIKKNIQISASGKYYSKPKIVGLTITGLVLGIFESKADKQNKITEIENKVTLLENKIDVLSIEERVDLTNTIEKEIVELRSRNQFNDNIKSRIRTCENRLEAAKVKSSNHIQNINKAKIKVDKSNVSVKKVGVRSNNRKKGVYTPVLEIKVLNKQVKDYQKKLKEINDKIKNTTNYNSLYDLEFAVKQLKSRFDDLLNRYSNLKELPGFDNLENIVDIKDIDIFNLRFNAESINLQIKTCNAYLDNIENTRKLMLNKKEEKQVEKEQKKEEQKKEDKKEKEVKKEEKKVEDKILEIKLANKIVVDRMVSERKNLAKFERSISKMGVKQKRRSIFYYTKNILSSIVNFGLSLFPLSLFKNKFIGGLASGIMINNSLRSVRRVLNPEVETIYVLYSDFEKELNHTSDYLSSINYVCNDSLNQIREIRNSIYTQYGADLEYSSLLGDYLKDLDNIESQVLREQHTIIDLQQQLQVTKVKNKQKIKEWRG